MLDMSKIDDLKTKWHTHSLSHGDILWMFKIIEQMKVTLEYYAEPMHYIVEPGLIKDVMTDGEEKARKTLGEIE